jgi:cysteine synthase A
MFKHGKNIQRICRATPWINVRTLATTATTTATTTTAIPTPTTNPLPAHQHQNILSTIGKTPLVKLSNRINPTESDIYVKVEAMNPGGSVKDRLALGIIEWAEQEGHLAPGQTVVECTSGNTGIGLAMVCAQKGYPLVVVMAESFSIERRKLMRFLGAKVILTNPAHKGSGMLIKAKELSEQHGWFLPRQFENQANSAIHETTTAPEILEALGDDTPLDHFFVSYGTGGTMKGCSRHLRQQSPTTQIHVAEPDNAPLLYSNVKSEWNADSTVKVPHPLWRPHLLQGWTADFLPKLVQEAQDEELIDHVVHVNGDKAMETSRELGQKEGILTGPSGGGTVSAALAFARDTSKCLPGSTIVAVLADTGERYLSTPLFADISADMNQEERDIAASTPSAEPPSIDLPPVDPASMEFVTTRSKGTVEVPIVVWSLQSCEFCWTAFGLLEALGLERDVDYAVIDIDSFQYAKDNQGNKYRAALHACTSVNTFPQVFVKGEFVGGAVDLCMLWKEEKLKGMLEQEAGLVLSDWDGDPFEFLPKWMSQNPLRSR